ncbi:MAG: succinylglutamate desuccinylase/aspartoacylase family protein, partial [Terrimesophilobacter sp.]
SSELLPLADFMIDIHSGGSKSVYVPSTFVYAGPTEDAWQQKVDAVNAMDLPYAIVVEPGMKSGSLSGAADLAGVWMISAELGGAGTIDQKILSMARDGLRHLLGVVGVLPLDNDTKPAREEHGSQTTWIALESDSAILSTVSGLFEPTVELGESVVAGQPVGRVHFIEELGRSAKEFFAPFDGIVAVTRHPALVVPGSALINIAIPMKGPHQRS